MPTPAIHMLRVFLIHMVVIMLVCGFPRGFRTPLSRGLQMTSIEYFKTIAPRLSCEAIVKDAFKAGLSAGCAVDLIALAREQDTMGPESSLTHKRLYGVPCFMAHGDIFLPTLMEEGALVFRETMLQINPHETHPRNPRDENFLLDTASPSSATRAVESVSTGKVAFSLIPCPPSDLLFPLSLSWSGLVGLRLPAATEGGAVVLCGTSVSDVAYLRMLLTKRQAQSHHQQSGHLVGKEPAEHPLLPLKGYKIAVLAKHTLTDLSSDVEYCVSTAVLVCVEMLERLGAECKQIKVSKDESGRLFLDSDLREQGFSAICSPAAQTAALAVGATAAKKGNVKTMHFHETIRNEWIDNLSVTIPVGLVAGEDDGYDDSLNEEKHREGLPINICISSLSKDTDEACLFLAASYTSVTRWSSEVFKVGATRLNALEDIDDARESFGIFFVQTMLRYLGKKM